MRGAFTIGHKLGWRDRLRHWLFVILSRLGFRRLGRNIVAVKGRKDWAR